MCHFLKNIDKIYIKDYSWNSMNRLYLAKYIKAIENLPDKTNYEYSDLLIDDFLIEKDNNLGIYYAPFDFVNECAKVVIIGITPGFTQMEIGIRKTRENLLLGKSFKNILKIIKEDAAFAGQMRKNLIAMLDELDLNKYLCMKSCSLLFEKENQGLTHMTSLIRYPVFNNGKDYTGHFPEILKSNLLKSYVQELFIEELNSIKYSLIIPLGTAVSNVLEWIKKDGCNIDNKCLLNFPHPSGANGHRIKIFNEKKDEYKKMLKKIFN
jgi:hypothetical protein